jgi:hypothetical protein
MLKDSEDTMIIAYLLKSMVEKIQPQHVKKKRSNPGRILGLLRR